MPELDTASDNGAGHNALLQTYLHAETEPLVASGSRLTVIGRRDRLPTHLSNAIDHAERATIAGRQLHLRVALDYSSRESIAVRRSETIS